MDESFHKVRPGWDYSNLLKMAKQRIQNHEVRWQKSAGKQLAAEVWKRLSARESLNDLGLGEHDKLIDLRGIPVPEVTKEQLPPFRSWDIHRVGGRLVFKNVQLEGMDFSDSHLEYIRFFHSRITGCRFDRADCRHWGVRASDVTRTSFVGTNLRDAVLGPWYEGRANKYEFVNFSYADMRGLLSSTATFTDCDFSHARLDKTDFQSSSFIRCRFAGEVREVLFYDLAYKSPKPDPNPMEDVDFSAAQLRWVEFRHLDIDRVRLPKDDNHVVVRNYRCVLQKALAAARNSQHRSSRALVAVLENCLKWIGPKQQIGIFNRLDFRDSGGTEKEEFVLRTLRQAEHECSRPQ